MVAAARCFSFTTLAMLATATGCRAPSTVTPDPGPAQATSSQETPMTTSHASNQPSPAYVRPPVDELKRKLTPLQFKVTQNDATEPPFRNEFWDNHAPGIYVDVATGEPLFSSLDKFESGTGWPSFTQPIEGGRVVSKTDVTFGMMRVEVRSHAGDSHLGHVFDDGPAPTGQRYCINSASLRFVPVARLAAEGYAAYASRFAGGAVSTVPASTDNACAVPPPGSRAGCEATLDTAIVAGDGAAKAALVAVAGVLEVQDDAGPGKLRVIFDPKQITREALVERAGKLAAAPRPGGK
jgi:peptide methionine sulfoxide reductase msrA/msrB